MKDLSQIEYKLLVVVDGVGPFTGRELAQAYARADAKLLHGTFYTTLSRLGELKLVKVRRCKTDRRIKIFKATKKGAEAVRKMRERFRTLAAFPNLSASRS